MDAKRRPKSFDADAIDLEDQTENVAGDENPDRKPQDELQPQKPVDASEIGQSSNREVGHSH